MNKPWYESEGLAFRCTGCGKCCVGSSGFVFLSHQDIQALADHLQITPKEFIERYTRIVDGRICLLDAPQSDECIFLKDRTCAVYPSRPIQCRTFPWWPSHLQSPAHWKAAAQHCEGINHPEADSIPGPEISCACMRYLDNIDFE